MAKVLLVEDDNNLREIYQARMEAEGFETFSAHDGEEALVIAKEKKPDLIIADIMMPRVSGLEMLDILRNTAGMQEVKVIMLTALGQSEDQQKASSLGANKYLVKSQVTLEDIVNAAHELLGDAPAPTASTPPAPDPQAGVTTPPVTQIPVSTPPPSTNDDKLLDDASKALSGTSPEDEAPMVPPTVPGVPDATEPALPTSSLEIDKALQEQIMKDNPGTDEVSTKDTDLKMPDPPLSQPMKVLQPIANSKPKKDIKTLLAQEEAKESQASQPQPAPTSPPDPIANEQSKSADPAVNPNDIAL